MRLPETLTTFAMLLLATAANATTITLRAGDYGAAGVACDRQANATILSFDGRDFAYPHATRCTDRVVGASAGVLTIAETCRAAGDGRPTRPDSQRFRLRQQGPAAFALIATGRTTTYRRCGPRGYFDRH